MDLHCIQCCSLELRRLSLVYQQGRFDVKTRTRLRGLLLGTGGLDLVVGGANSTGFLQSQLSRNLHPPVKWSYLRLVARFAIGSFVALIVYAQLVMSSAGKASSLPVVIYAVVVSGLFLILGFVIWRHNHRVYRVQYAEWERSFLCMRCGAVSAQGP